MNDPSCSNELRASTSYVRAHGTPAPFRSGLTLIELLVVVAILSTLVAILLPGLAHARRQARATVCLTKLRELGRFTVFFNGESNDTMPRSMHSAFAHRALPWGYEFYRFATGRHFERENDMWFDVFNRNYRCPLDKRRGRNQWSYGYNVYFELTERETGGRSWRKAIQIPRPSSTVLFGEIGGPDDTLMPDHIMAHFWTKHDAPPEVAADRHEPHSGYQFADGHAANLAFNKTFDTESGRNLWDPNTAQ